MSLSDIIWFMGAGALAMYLAVAGFIFASVAVAYYRRRK